MVQRAQTFLMLKRPKWHTKGSTKHFDSTKPIASVWRRRKTNEKRRRRKPRIRYARIKSGVIGPIFDEVVARLAAAGFFGETVDEQNDASGPISLNVNLSEDEEFTRQGSRKCGLIQINIRVNLEHRRWLRHHQPVK
jgi:hypothetical protein